MKRIYLDYAATTPTDPEVIKAMEPYFFEKFGNPSSIHSFGQEAKKAIEEARKIISDFLGAEPEEIVFTSGGTEANNFALEGVAFALENKGRHIITSAIEHHSVTEPLKFLEKRGFRVTYINVDRYGLVSPEDIKKAIRDDTILISVMHANNEMGTIEPISEISKIAKERDIYFHSDCVQTVGHIPVNVDDLGLELLSLSGHKFYGPKGVGALYIRKGTKIIRFLHGGDQERKRRSSTENVSGIVGMARAIQICKEKMEKEAEEQSTLRDRLIKEIQNRIEEVYLNGHPTKRLPNNINFSIPYIEGESILLNLDLAGICASSGSACTSDSLEPSHVLLATGQPAELAHSSLRLTLGRWTKPEEIDYLLEVLPKVVEKLRKMSPLYKGG